VTKLSHAHLLARRRGGGGEASRALPAGYWLDVRVEYGMHGGIYEFYHEKYGVENDKSRPATIDHFCAAVAG